MLVVNKAFQHKYYFNQTQTDALPEIIERQETTIDISVSNQHLEALPAE